MKARKYYELPNHTPDPDETLLDQLKDSEGRLITGLVSGLAIYAMIAAVFVFAYRIFPVLITMGGAE